MTALRIGIIVCDGNHLSIGALNLLDALCADVRFNLTAIFTAPERKTSAPLPFTMIMRIEASVFARRRTADAGIFQRARSRISEIDLSQVEQSRLKHERLDVIINLTGDTVADLLAENARFGVWSLNAYDDLAGFWEAYEAAPVTSVELVRESPDAAGRGLIASAAYNTKFIASSNAAFVREKSVQLLLRELARVSIERMVKISGAAAPRRDYPSIFQIAVYLLRLGAALSRRIFRAAAARAGLRPGMWFLKYGKGELTDFNPSTAVSVFPEGNRYWADPFLLTENGSHYVFFEDYSYRTKTGHISAGQIENGEFRLIGAVLKADYHLSYPFIFRSGSDIFMIPETEQARRIEVWRCVEFPLNWELHATALEGRSAADTILFERAGEWWLFTNLSGDSYEDHCSELHIFKTDGPQLNELTPHKLNPVVIDARTARGGGRVFEQGGRLFRASQCNSFGEYGYGLNLMEIERLDLDAFSEKVVRRIEPDFERGIMGCHHFDIANGLYVIDVRKKFGGLAR